MIGYLKGTLANLQRSSSNRFTLTIEVNQIGYEVQIPPRLAQQMPVAGEPVQVFAHLQVREDQMVLYGFATATERDLFRVLIGVSGVGAALAIALLDTLGLQELVQAIVTGDTRTLAKTPGVGNKTAERLALELKTKLAEWHQAAGLMTAASGQLAPAMREDVEMTLLALGYSSREVAEALEAVSQDAFVGNSKNAEDWIRGAIAWLSE